MMERRTALAAAATALVALLGPSLVAVTPASALDAYRWKKRPVVVFAPSEQDARLARQKTIVGGNRTAFLDRDIVVVYVIGGTLTHDLGPGPGINAGALRATYRIGEAGFRVLLVGKDGGVKLDSPTPIAATDLFAEIDRMPMRRDEVRRRSTERP